jgi:hypothetical protein
MKSWGKSMAQLKNNGTTRGRKKTHLILKDFFLLKFGANEQSMAWGEKSHEDGLSFLT